MESHYWCSLCWLTRLCLSQGVGRRRHGAASSPRETSSPNFSSISVPSSSSSDVCFPIKTIKTNRLTRSNCFFFVTHSGARLLSLRARRKLLRTSFSSNEMTDLYRKIPERWWRKFDLTLHPIQQRSESIKCLALLLPHLCQFLKWGNLSSPRVSSSISFKPSWSETGFQ